MNPTAKSIASCASNILPLLFVRDEPLARAFVFVRHDRNIQSLYEHLAPRPWRRESRVPLYVPRCPSNAARVTAWLATVLEEDLCLVARHWPLVRPEPGRVCRLSTWTQ